MFRIALPLIFIVAAIAGFIFFINPTYKLAQENKLQLDRVNDALKKANQLRDIRDKLAIERNKISDTDLARILKMIPDSVENIGLIIELNNIARDKGMELMNPTIGTGGSAGSSGGINVGPESKKYGSLAMVFSVNTTYEKFIDFMKELEHSLRLVDVREVKFSSPDPKTGKSLYEIKIDTYWLKPVPHI